MAGGIHLNSIRSLEDLALALAVFASDCRETVAAAQADISRCVSTLEDRCRGKLLAIQSLQYDYEHTDEDEHDERSSLRYEIMLAEEAYERARSSLRSAEDAAFEFARAASRAREVADHRIPEACAFLRQKVYELNEYVAAQPGGGGPAGIASAARDTPASAKVSLTDFALPKGFRWVRLDEIAPHEIAALPSAAEFRDVSYEVMKAGLGVLKDKILPALRETGGRADQEYFRRLDEEGGGDAQAGARTVFDAFFGTQFKDYPRVERFKGSPHYSITNGRHRMKVALDLGWDAIPAEAVDVERKE